MNLDYIQTKKHCQDICFESHENELSEDCIEEISQTFGIDESKIGTEYCLEQLQDNICEIIDTPQFKSLILFFIIFLRFIYSVRFAYQNIYDEDLVPIVSNVNLTKFGLSLQQLSCVKFPDQESFVRQGFPNKLDTYLQLLHAPIDTNLKMEYNEFFTDYQPWARLLSDFIDNYGKDELQTYFNITKLPKIEKTKNYGTFVSIQYIEYFKTNKNSENFKENLINFIYNEMLLLQLKKSNKSNGSQGNKSNGDQGYIVSETSWKRFINFMKSEKELQDLKQEELQELCNSLKLCDKSKGDKMNIISKLMTYFKDRIHLIEPRVIPSDLMTVYCANPNLVCINQIPTNV